MKKLILFLDMDCVLADFSRSDMFEESDRKRNSPPQMYEKYFFETLPPVDGCLSSVRELMQSNYFDIHVLSQPVKETHYSYSEKAAWIAKWFPELNHNLILTQDKSLMSAPGRILLDDNDIKWKKCWEDGGGVFFKFHYTENKHTNRIEWSIIVKQILSYAKTQLEPYAQ